MIDPPISRYIAMVGFKGDFVKHKNLISTINLILRKIPMNINQLTLPP